MLARRPHGARHGHGCVRGRSTIRGANGGASMRAQGAMRPTTIYDMDSLQGVSQKRNYFISINDPGDVDPKHILWQKDYMHPLFNARTLAKQKLLPQLNKNPNNTDQKYSVKGKDYQLENGSPLFDA